jgi:hypothetical protein
VIVAVVRGARLIQSTTNKLIPICPRYKVINLVEALTTADTVLVAYPEDEVVNE